MSVGQFGWRSETSRGCTVPLTTASTRRTPAHNKSATVSATSRKRGARYAGAPIMTMSPSGPARIVGAFSRDGHVVGVALSPARCRDTQETGFFTELGEIGGTDIAHRRA